MLFRGFYFLVFGRRFSSFFRLFSWRDVEEGRIRVFSEYLVGFYMFGYVIGVFIRDLLEYIFFNFVNFGT